MAGRLRHPALSPVVPQHMGARAIVVCPLARAKGGAASARPATGLAIDGHERVAALLPPPRPRRHSPTAVCHRRADRKSSFVRGRCRTACIRIFYHMLDILYSFKPAIDDISRWKDDMPLFAKLIYEAGSSPLNCAALFDGTFQRHCKPGGGRGGAALGLQRECWNPYYVIYVRRLELRQHTVFWRHLVRDLRTATRPTPERSMSPPRTRA